MYSVGYLIGLPLGNYVKKQFGYVLNSTVHFSKQNKYTKSSINGRTSGIWHEHWVLRISLFQIVLHKKIFYFFLRRLVHELLVVSDDGFRNRLPYCVNLCDLSTTTNTDTDVDGRESFLSNDEDRFLDFHAQCYWFHEVQWSTVDFDQTVTSLAKGYGRGCFLPSEDLY